MTVWVVVWASEYDPVYWVDSVWTTREAAEESARGRSNLAVHEVEVDVPDGARD